MKEIFILTILLLSVSCQENTNHSGARQKEISDAKGEPPKSYKPGFGEFMTSIQIHHAKLWFAGQNENWALADFEIHEIEEGIEDIQRYQSARPESKELPMINPELDSVLSAIDQKDKLAFDRTYNLLTHTCNTCHKVTNHGFIQIKIPDNEILSNQKFNIDSDGS